MQTSLLRSKTACLCTILVVLVSTPLAHAQYFPKRLDAKTQRSHPYNKIGQLEFFSGEFEYSGSGTVIMARGVLTAAHNLYDAEGGFSTNIRFYRARRGGTWANQRTAQSLYILADYPLHEAESDAGFRRDLGGVRFFSRLAPGGKKASVGLNQKILRSNSPKEILGYGGEFNSGNHLLRAKTNRPFFSFQRPFLGNTGFYTEDGMSGGPVLVRHKGKLTLYGIAVSSEGGTRALDRDFYKVRSFLR